MSVNVDYSSSTAIGTAILSAFGIDPNTVSAFTLTAAVDSMPSLTVTHVAPNFAQGKWDDFVIEYTLSAKRVDA